MPSLNNKECGVNGKYHTMKAHLGVEVYIITFLTSALDGGEWSD